MRDPESERMVTVASSTYRDLDLPFGTDCHVCRHPIADGQLVIYEPRQGWIHGACKVLVFDA